MSRLAQMAVECVSAGCLCACLAIALPNPVDAEPYAVLFDREGPKSRKANPVAPRHLSATLNKGAEHAAPSLHDTPADLPLKATQFPLVAIVSIASQRLVIYDDTGPVLHARVSTGQPGHRTPLGVFKVIQKQRYHESNIYSGAPMPFMQRITWSGIAMHAGHLPGYPASHGCIRLPESIATQLFGVTKVGMTVIVAPSDTAAVELSHRLLPVPTMTSLPQSGSAQTPRVTDTAPSPAIKVVAAQSGSPDFSYQGGRPEVPSNLVNPHQRAVEDLPRARQAAIDATKTAQRLLEASQAASSEANAAAAEIRDAASAVATKVRDLANFRTSATGVATNGNLSDTAMALKDAELQYAAAVGRLESAKATEELKNRQAFAAADAWREANARIETAAEAAKAAARAVNPISVFISRKEGRLFVRQGFLPLFDAPVTFKGSGRLGTHVYTAMSADEATGQLRWQAVTVPDEGADKSARASERQSGTGQPVLEVATAAEALDRVDIDANVMTKLNERVWLGGSVIISDNGLSDETGTDTDFVVLTH